MKGRCFELGRAAPIEFERILFVDPARKRTGLNACAHATPTLVTAASADCTTYYTRLTQGCIAANNKCNCRFQPRNDKGRGKGKECVPEPAWKCNKNASKCKSKSEKKRKKCVRDKRRGKG